MNSSNQKELILLAELIFFCFSSEYSAQRICAMLDEGAWDWWREREEREEWESWGRGGVIPWESRNRVVEEPSESRFNRSGASESLPRSGGFSATEITF